MNELVRESLFIFYLSVIGTISSGFGILLGALFAYIFII